jgi:outer membrane protein assembly factor BamB
VRQANLAAAVLAAFATCCASARAADWPQFGFDAAHTSNQPNEQQLTRTTARGLRFAWSVDVPAPLFGGAWYVERPSVGSGRLYVATGDGFSETCGPPCGAGLFAFDARTGAPLWSRLVPGGWGVFEPTYQHVPGRVWLVDDVGHQSTFDATGGALVDQRGTGASVGVTLNNPFVYVVGADSLTRLSASGGDWTVSGLAITNEVAVFHGVVYATGNTPAGSFAWAIRASDGRILWRAQLPDSTTMPVVDDDGVYVSGGSSLMALDPRDGSLRWRNERFFALAPPALARHRLVFNAEDPNFGLFAVDTRTGDILWSNDITGEGQCVPALANGVAYVVTEDGRLAAVNTATGETLAVVTDPSGLPLDGGLDNPTRYPQVAVAGGRVYATTATRFGPNRVDVFDVGPQPRSGR